jgi:tetratricopeptide (TPR) repeat protein
MAAPARAVLDAASKVEVADDAKLVILLDERRVEYAPGGAARHRYRTVYHVRSAAAVEQADKLQASWAPWLEGRPALRARVISRDARIFELDPKAIETRTPREAHDDIFTDRSLLRAPLPGIGPGAVVETEIVTQENQPLFDQGVVESFTFITDLPTQKARLIVDAPVSLPIKFELTNAEIIQRTETRTGDRVVTQFEGGPLVPRLPLYPYSPPELYRSRYVSYTTGQSWQRVAERYLEIVNEKLRGADVRAWAQEATQGKKSREAIIAALVARLRQEIRYTGLEFGESSIVPRTPAEVFANRFGDCKDQAVLLVALLRAVGIEAHVALLSAGIGHDVFAALPGFGLFNHAIVYLPARGSAARDVWIDPVARFVPPGELPLTDQGRLALVARAGTTKLLKTPVAPSTANLTREERDLTLSEDGKLVLKEHTTYWGAGAAHMRANLASAARKDIDKHLNTYANEQYKSKKVISTAFSEPTDLGQPFTLTVTVEGAELGQVGGEQAQIQLQLAQIFHDLPEDLRSAEAAAKHLPPELKDRPRTSDFEYARPFSYELVYRITPAHGFTVQALPPAEKHSFGVASLQFSCSANKKGVVEARFRFDSGKNRLSPKELAQFQETFAAFAKTSVPLVRFSLAAENHLTAGDLKAALAAFRALDDEHPNTAHHSTQLARAYLLAGLGEAARREAKRATALDPKSVEAWRMLGTVLEHDLLGRPMKPGFDRTGAEAAFRKAVEVDDQDTTSLRELALMAEYDDEGNHTWPRHRLRDIKASHERYQKINKSSEQDINYLMTLFYLGQYRDVIDKARTAPKVPAAVGLALASTALLKSPTEAIRESSALVPEAADRAEALRSAGGELLGLRRYPESLALLTEAARTHKQAPVLRLFIEGLRKTKRRETLSFDERDPRQVVSAFLASLMGEGDIKRYFADNELPAGGESAEFKRVARKAISKGTREQIPFSVLVDLAVSMERIQEGDPRWGVWVRTPGTDTGFFLVPRDGRFRLLFNDPDIVPALGREAIRRLDKHDLDGARYLLGKIDERPTPATTLDDPLAAPPFTVLWRYGNRQDEQALRLMALVAQKGAPPASELLPLVEAGMRGGPDVVRDACELLRARLLWGQNRRPEAKAAMARLAERIPTSRTAQLGLAGQFTAEKEWDKATALVQKVLTAKPDDEEALRALRRIWVLQNQLAKVIDLYARTVAHRNKPDQAHNEMAWIALFLPTLDGRALEHARQAVSLSARRNGAYLHTLATVLAELGHPEEARQTLLELFDLDGIEEPRSIDWYIIGRIAEDYGELRTAVSAYKKAAQPKDPEPLSTGTLAERRLRLLENKVK